jgi:hypothetical protein
VHSSSSLEVQIELPQNSTKANEKGQKRLIGDNISVKRKETEPLVAVTSSTSLVPEPSLCMVETSVVTSSQVR